MNLRQNKEKENSKPVWEEARKCLFLVFVWHVFVLP